MELRLLEDFVCLSEVSNFSRAAELRHVTQSTLSKRIRMLEHWVGASLVDRSTYPVSLTTEGRIMLPQARELVRQINGLRAGIRSSGLDRDEKIRVLAMHTLRVTCIPIWHKAVEARIGSFEEYPCPANTAYSETTRQFRNDESDFLLTYVHPSVSTGFEASELESITLGRERIIPVSAPDGAGNPLHSLETDGIIRYLSYGAQSFFGQVLAPVLRENPLPLNVVAINAMSVGLHSLALVGTGVAWIPESLAHEDLEAGRLVVAGKENWTIFADISMYRKKTAKRRPLAEKVWDATLQEAQSVITPFRQRYAQSYA